MNDILKSSQKLRAEVVNLSKNKVTEEGNPKKYNQLHYIRSDPSLGDRQFLEGKK